jgi:WD40 repeat protein
MACIFLLVDKQSAAGYDQNTFDRMRCLSRPGPCLGRETSNMLPRFALGLFAAFILAPTARAQPPAKPRTDALGDPLPAGAVPRLGTLRFKHNFGHGSLFFTTITTAVFAPDAKTMASLALPFGSICLWDPTSGKQMPGPWSSSKNYFQAIAIAPNGATLAAAGHSKEDNESRFKIVVWDIGKAKELKNLRHGGDADTYFQALAFADGGKTLVSAGDGIVNWWDIASGKVNRSWKPPLPSPPQSSDPKIETETFYEYFLSSDAKSLVVHLRCYQYGPDIPADFTVSESLGFNLATGKLRWWITSKVSNAPKMNCAFSGDSKRVAISVGSNKVELHDAVTGRLIDKLSLDSNANHMDYLSALALSPDGGTVAITSQEGHIVLWNPAAPSSAALPAEARNAEQTGKLRTLIGHPAAQARVMRSLAFSPDGKTLFVGAGADLQNYDVATLKEVTPWVGHRGWVDHVVFSSDGQRLFSSSGQGNFRPEEVANWDVASWKQLQLTSQRAPLWPNIGISSPEHTYYVGKDGEDLFCLYDQGSGKPLGRFLVPPWQKIAAGFFSPGSKFYLLPGRDEHYKFTTRLFGVPSCKLLCQLPALPFFDCFESSLPLAFSADDRLVAMFGQDDDLIDVFETATGKLSKRLGRPAQVDRQRLGPRVGSRSLAFSPDGKLLASWNLAEPAVRIWDVAAGREWGWLPPDDQSHYQMHLAWSPDGRMLALGDRKIQLWEMATPKIRREFTGHEGDVRCLAFSPDGKLLASGSMDSTVLIWEVWEQ